MKFLIVALAFLASVNAHAVAIGSVGVKIEMSTSGADTTHWTPILAQSSKAIKGISVFSSTQNPLEIGIAASSQASTAEVSQLIVAPGTMPGNAYAGSPLGAYNSSTNFYPISVSQGQRLSLRLLDSTSTSGRVIVNVFYF